MRWAEVWPRLRRWLSPGYVLRRLRQNWLPKLLALALATVLWFLSTEGERATVEQSYDVPITVRDTTGGTERRAVSGLTPQSVRVTLSGRPERLRELRGTNIEAVLDVTGEGEGSFNRPVTVVPPPSTTLSRVLPERAEGFVDTEVSRPFGVVVSVAAPPENALLRYVATPAEVTVSGTGRVLGTVERVVTSPVGLSPGEEASVNLLALDAQGQPVGDVRLQPSRVTVLRGDSGDLPVKSVRVRLAPPPPGWRVRSAQLEPAVVRVIALPGLLARLQEVVGETEYREGNYAAPVRLNLPAGAQALEEVQVRLQVERAP